MDSFLFLFRSFTSPGLPFLPLIQKPSPRQEPSSTLQVIQQIGYVPPANPLVEIHRKAAPFITDHKEQKRQLHQRQINLKHQFKQHEKPHPQGLNKPIQQPSKRLGG